MAAFEKLLKVRPDHAPGLNYLGYMWADRGENLPRALELIRKAVDLEPGNGAYLDSLGWVYYRLDKLDKAEKNLRAAAVLNPDDATVEEHLGDLFEKKGDLAHARDELEARAHAQARRGREAPPRREAPEDRRPRRAEVKRTRARHPLLRVAGSALVSLVFS